MWVLLSELNNIVLVQFRVWTVSSGGEGYRCLIFCPVLTKRKKSFFFKKKGVFCFCFCLYKTEKERYRGNIRHFKVFINCAQHVGRVGLGGLGALDDERGGTVRVVQQLEPEGDRGADGVELAAVREGDRGARLADLLPLVREDHGRVAVVGAGHDLGLGKGPAVPGDLGEVAREALGGTPGADGERGRGELGRAGELGGAVEVAVEVQVDQPGLVHDRDGDGLLELEGLLGRQGGGAVGGGDPDDELAAGVDRDAGLAALAEHAGRRWRRSRRWARAT